MTRVDPLRCLLRQLRQLEANQVAKLRLAPALELVAHCADDQRPVIVVTFTPHPAQESLRDQRRDVNRQLRQGLPVNRQDSTRAIEANHADREIPIPQDL